MGIYVPTLLAATNPQAGTLPLNANEVTAALYNAAYEDQNGTAFPAGLTAAQVIASLDVTTSTVADDDLTIPPGNAVTLKNTGTDAEACTLADGSEIGQITTVQMVEDSNGDATMTVTTSTTVATVIFADVGDTATLQWRGSTLGWVLLGCFGLTAQPTITL